MKSQYESFAKFYDSFMGKETAEFFVGKIKKFLKEYYAFNSKLKSKSLLEIGCGTGTNLVLLKKDFKEVAGLDLSKNMLKVARKKLPNVKFFNADMNNFSLKKQYDVVILMYDTINHLLTDKQWEATFDNTYYHLKDDGVFIFDCNVKEKFSKKVMLNRKPHIKKIGNDYVVMDLVNENSSTIFKLFFIKKVNKGYMIETQDIKEIAFSISKIKKCYIHLKKYM